MKVSTLKWMVEGQCFYVCAVFSADGDLRREEFAYQGECLSMKFQQQHGRNVQVNPADAMSRE